MIDDLLDEARIAANQLAVEARAGDLVELARAVIDNMRSETSNAPIRLVAPPHLIAWFDPDRVQQVLTNLISNALKYGRPGGEILVEIARQDAWTQVSVHNEGAEIATDELALLFSRFARTRSARRARTPGIGLGLYICKGLIEAHGGRIWAESEHGRTSFRFTLPEPPEVS
jgi:signal transduction histidine kinase